MFDPQELARIRAALEQWQRQTLDPALQRMPERQAEFSTMSDEPIARLYTPLDVAGSDPLHDIGFPGDYPYTRGIHPTGYRAKLWTMRMFAGFGSAEETNARFKYLL